MYICTLSRMQPLKLLCAAIALVTLGLPVSAQNARTSGNTAQAELHINVNVVRVVAPPFDHKDRDRARDEASMAYNLEPRQEELSVSEEARPLLVDLGNNAVRQEQVRVLTVVLK